MLNLMLHCGSNEIHRTDLLNVATPEPEGRWFPIPHWDFLQEVTSAMGGSELEVVNEAHAINRNGAHYFGIMELRAPTEDADYTTVIGLRNSHNKDFSAQLVVGSGVFVCDNLAFSGEINIRRRHTRNIASHLPELLQAAVAQVPLVQAAQENRITNYRKAPLDNNEADILMMELYRRGIVPPSHLGKVHEEWRTPSHPEFTEGGTTVWRLFNAITESMKGRIHTLQRATMPLHELLDDYIEGEFAPLAMAA